MIRARWLAHQPAALRYAIDQVARPKESADVGGDDVLVSPREPLVAARDGPSLNHARTLLRGFRIVYVLSAGVPQVCVGVRRCSSVCRSDFGRQPLELGGGAARIAGCFAQVVEPSSVTDLRRDQL
jgi:hypothetical protein